MASAIKALPPTWRMAKPKGSPARLHLQPGQRDDFAPSTARRRLRPTTRFVSPTSRKATSISAAKGSTTCSIGGAISRSTDRAAKSWCIYAEDEKTEKRQTAAIAGLVSLRGRLQFLMAGMKGPNPYHGQIAEALRLCLDGRKAEANALLQMLIDTIIEHRLQEGRDFYLMSTGAMVLTIIAMLGVAAAGMWWLWHTTPDELASGLRYLMLATGSGAMGAMLSTALALQARNCAAAMKTHVDPRWNAVDGAARILIGVISAAALYLFLDSDFLGAIKIGALPLKPVIEWKSALLVGFAAGFLERLVPDLLEKKLAAVTK